MIAAIFSEEQRLPMHLPIVLARQHPLGIDAGLRPVPTPQRAVGIGCISARGCSMSGSLCGPVTCRSSLIPVQERSQ